MTMTPQPPSFDWRPLREPVSRHTVREWNRAQPAEARGGSRAPTIVAVAVVSFLLIIFVSGFISVGATIANSMSAPATPTMMAFLTTPLLILLVIVVGIVIAVIAMVRRASLGNAAAYRLDRFARANGMTFVRTLRAPQLPGMIFSLGSARSGYNLVRGTQPRFVEFGNYRYTTGSGKQKRTHRWGYVAVKLEVPLPHIVLDAKGNNALFGSNLPIGFHRDQRLSLEGDFDRYFSLYCPAGYERDALYLFTPDIMARFIDNAAELDVEIVDDWLFLYSKRELSTLDPATWAWLFTVVRVLLDKLAQWARWRDERLAAAAAPAIPAAALTRSAAEAASEIPLVDSGAATSAPPLTFQQQSVGVAQPGQRLRRGVPWGAVLVFIGFGLMWLIQSGVMTSVFDGILGGR